ncbi:MAG TPA: amine dehydrogenase large subunit [Steroidobacteraceae bacterium]|nr:amine dehydrogenase large subunit [Steroidobacteraceae bacterium]
MRILPLPTSTVNAYRPFRRERWTAIACVAAVAMAAALAGPARATLPSDIGRGPTVATLPVPASKHWVWVNDFVFPHMADGMAYLIDGDSGRYLGTLSTGYGFAHLLLSRDGKIIYSPETYFSRGTRGKRTDVVTLYDAGTLNVLGEIVIPPKRSSNMPVMGNAALTDDDRFLLVYNFTPTQSITVVDTKTRKFVREIPTPGCAFAYPTGPRSFFSVCGDGSVLLVDLDDRGAARAKRTQPLLPMGADPVTEKPVRVGNTWYFVSLDGRIYPLECGRDQAALGRAWWLTSAAQRQAGWRPGGLQQLAVDARRSRLYAIMHRGALATHKDPGKDVWVYDLASGRRVQRIALRRLASSIQLSSDARPLLYAIFIGGSDLDVYDAISGKLLRSVAHVGTTPTLLVTP